MLLRNIHLTKQFNKKLVCRGIIPMSPEVPKHSEAVTNTVTNSISDNLEGSYIQQPQLISEESEQTMVADLGERRDTVSLTVDTSGDIGGGVVLSTPSTSEVLAVIEASKLNRKKSVKDLVTDFSSCVSNVSSSEGEGLGDWSESGDRRQRKKKRKPSSSPPQDGLIRKVPNQNI